MSISIRPATHADAKALCTLLVELGYPVSKDQMERSLSTIDLAGNDPVFVATHNGAIVGLVAVHIARWLQLDKPIARITALVVQSGHQRRGIGRRLIERALNHAREAGCGSVELTTAADRDGAHSFYKDIDFEETSIRFKRALT